MGFTLVNSVSMNIFERLSDEIQNYRLATGRRPHRIYLSHSRMFALRNHPDYSKMVRVQSAGQRKVWFEDIELECLVEHSLIAE